MSAATKKKRLVARGVEPAQVVLKAKPVKVMKAKRAHSDRYESEVDDEPKESKGFLAEVWGNLSPVGKIKTAIGLGILGLAVFVYIPLQIFVGLSH